MGGVDGVGGGSGGGEWVAVDGLVGLGSLGLVAFGGSLAAYLVGATVAR